MCYYLHCPRGVAPQSVQVRCCVFSLSCYRYARGDADVHRCFVGHPRHTALLASDPAMGAVDAVAQCMSAARSCINAADLVRDHVPPSHYLAFCVHYITLSGVVL